MQEMVRRSMTRDLSWRGEKSKGFKSRAFAVKTTKDLPEEIPGRKEAHMPVH